MRCLVSRADSSVKRAKERETQYSVEAISLNGSKSWIGINQCHVTRCGNPDLPLPEQLNV